MTTTVDHPDTLDFAIDDFYAFPTKENAKRLARIVTEYNNDEMIGDEDTQTILTIVSYYLENNH